MPDDSAERSVGRPPVRCGMLIGEHMRAEGAATESTARAAPQGLGIRLPDGKREAQAAPNDRRRGCKLKLDELVVCLLSGRKPPGLGHCLTRSRD
jgi:hypothetical protein